MRRFWRLIGLVAVLLLGLITASWAGGDTGAQEATPAAEEWPPEGITFEPVAVATEMVLPSPGELFVVRVGFESGTGFPVEEGDPTYALVVVESGELTVRQDGPLLVTRAGALGAAMAAGEEDGAFEPATEEIAAGQEVTLRPGDTALFAPNDSGEIRNDGQERTVVLAVIVGPPEDMAGEATPTP